MHLSSSILAVFVCKAVSAPISSNCSTYKIPLHSSYPLEFLLYCILLYPQDKHHPPSAEMKGEINATIMTLPTEQKERESDEFSPSTLERGNEDVVALKKEIAILIADLGKKQVLLKV